MAIKELFFEGKTIEIALENAAAQLFEDKDMLTYEVVQYPTKGIFGIGATTAKIKVEREVAEQSAPQKEKKAEQKEIKLPKGFAPEKISKKEPEKNSAPKQQPVTIERKLTPVTQDDEVAKAVTDFILGLLENLEIENGKVTVSIDEDGSYFAQIDGSKMGVLIGRRGEALDAAQYLTNLVINRGKDKKVKVILDSENYRAKRIAALTALANKTADKAIKYKRNQSLEPMGAYERRIIHASLTGREHITTYSVGTEPRRKVVISYQA